MKRTCLVASDEEDVDGNFSDKDPPKRMRPQRNAKKVALESFRSQCDDSDDSFTEKKPAGKPGRLCGRGTKHKPVPEPKTGPENIVFIKVDPGVSSESDSTSNAVKSTSDQQPSSHSETHKLKYPIKRGRYNRQATPLCDAIMKEYSKRQKLLKMQGKDSTSPDLSQLHLKEIMEKVKRENERKTSSSCIQSKSPTENKIKKTGSEEQNNTKQEILSATVKQEYGSEPGNGSENEIKIKSNKLLQPFVLLKRENLSPTDQPTPFEDNDEDPLWTPENSVKCRSTSRIRSSLQLKQNTTLKLNTEDDAQKPLRNTQQLIKRKNEKHQQHVTTPLIKCNIKQEPTDQSETSRLSTSDCDLSDITTSQPSNVSEDNAKPKHLKKKCTFVMEYFTSYQEVFGSQVFREAIPLLSEILLLCMNDLKDCLQRMKNARSITILELQQNEVQLASQAYFKVVMSFGEKFFNSFDSVAEKIVKSKTPKAVMITWIYFIMNSLFTIAPKYKGQMHKVRAVIMLISRIYKYNHPLVWEVLESPDQIFEKELNTLITIIKYYHDRNLVLVPDVNLFNLWLEYSGKDQHNLSADLSLMNELVTEIKIPSTLDKTRHKYSYENHVSLPSKTCMPSSNIAAQFIDVLQTDRDYNFKRVEEKLDHILTYLSDSKTQVRGVHNVKPACEQTQNESISHLSQILQHNQAGLDSLMMPHVLSDCKIKNEPVDYNEWENQKDCNESNNKRSDNVLSVKQEPEECIGAPQFASVVLPESETSFYPELND